MDEAPYWQLSAYWLELALPTICFLIGLILSIIGLWRKRFARPLLIWMSLVIAFFALVISQSLRLIGADLVRNGQLALLNGLNDAVLYAPWLLAGLGIVILLVERKWLAIGVLLMAIGLVGAIRYLTWGMSIIAYVVQ